MKFAAQTRETRKYTTPNLIKHIHDGLRQLKK